jgi:hypothetical protein
VSDRHRPAGKFELVFDPDRAAHHLDAALDLAVEPQRQLREAVFVS